MNLQQHIFANQASLPVKEATIKRQEKGALVEEYVAVEGDGATRQLALLQHVVQVSLAVEDSFWPPGCPAAPVDHCRQLWTPVAQR